MRPSSIELSVKTNYSGPMQRSCGFAEPYRETVQELASHSGQLSDLSESFPALLFALATGFGTSTQRQQAYDMICEGQSLKLVADVLGMPMWLRKLPAQAFEDPIPTDLPNSPSFAKHIVNLLPAHTVDMSMWLKKISRAYALCDEGFALWVANNPLLYSRSNEVGENDATLELLAAWAWRSQRPETYSCTLNPTPWHPHIGLHKALDAAKTWYNRTKLVLFIGENGIEDCWLNERSINGYDIVPLRTAEDFILESQAMNNCLDQYADQIRFHRVRVFSVRRDGMPIANIEIGPHEDDRSMPGLEQVRGPKNRRVNALLWQLAYCWLGQQNFSARPNGPSWPSVSYPIALHPIWEDYRRALHERKVESTRLAIFNLDQTEKLLMQIESLSLIDS